MATVRDVEESLSHLIDFEDDPQMRKSNCEHALSALELTLGLWQEAGYAHKGSKIARKIEDYIGRYPLMYKRCWDVILMYNKAHIEYLQTDLLWSNGLSELYSKLEHADGSFAEKIQQIIDLKMSIKESEG